MRVESRITSNISKNVFLIIIILILTTNQIRALEPPIDKKFAVYGNNPKIHTELRGIVYGVIGSELYIKPDTNYINLLIEGNKRKPIKGEDGYDFYSDFISDTETIPVIKLEYNYPVGSWPSESPSTAPMVNDRGNFRPLKVGDHIKVTGLYVTDNAHTMFSILCTDSFSLMRGMYRACFPHSELHPYDYYTIEIIQPLQPGDANIETHTVAAPIYDEYYSNTYFWNKIWGVAGHFVDSSKREIVDAEWFIEAPPAPIGANPEVTHTLIIGEAILFSPRDIIKHSITKESNGYRVKITIQGNDVSNPSIFQATYNVYWQELTPTPVLTKIIVSPGIANVVVDDTQDFSSYPKDQYDNPIATTVIWSSIDTNVGTIDNNGMFTAKASGTTAITATSGSIIGTATVVVTVYKPVTPEGTRCKSGQKCCGKLTNGICDDQCVTPPEEECQ